MRKTRNLKAAFAMIVLLITASITVPITAAEKDTVPDTQELFAAKVQELEENYGFMPAGSISFETDIADDPLLLPEDIAAGEEGILLSKVSDFDGDDSPELLVIRRQKVFANVNYGGFQNATDRHDYLFEMYEVKEGSCRICARMVVGVFDTLNMFISRTCASFFLHESEDGTGIFMETLFSGQDQPEDISIICFTYKGGYFVDHKGLRYGNISCGENSLRCLLPESADAYGYLSVSSPEKNHWTAVAQAESYDDDSFKAALSDGLGQLGLSLIQTRNDLIKGNASDSGQEDPESAYAITAKDCYAPETGSLEMMAFIETHLDNISTGSGHYSWKSNRRIYTEELKNEGDGTSE